MIAASLCAAGLAAGMWACGGSTSTSVVGPDDVRCQTTVSGGPTSMPHTGGELTVNVSAARDCAWDASSDASWMQLSSTSGQGEGTITATVAANDRGAARTGAVIVNDQRLSVSQEPRPCPFDLRASPNRISAEGGRGSIQVETVGGCGWTASSSASWLRVLTASGEGSGEAAFEADPNPGAPREAAISVAGRPVLVSQLGAGGTDGPGAPGCSATVGPASVSAPADGGPVTVTLAIGSTCDWTASSSAGWATVEPASGRGPATITITAASNSGGARTATVTVAGEAVTVRQDAAPPCTYSLDSSSRNFPAGGGEGRVRVTTQPACGWSASGAPSWIGVSTTPRTGSGEITYSVAENSSTSGRSATLTIGGRSHTVTQEAAAPPPPVCTYSLAPPTHTIGADGGERSVTVTTGAECTWTPAADAPWIAVSGDSRTGPGSFTYTAQPNSSQSPRTASIAAGGQTHTVTQEAAAPPPPVCTYSLAPPTHTIGADGGERSVTVTTGAECTWSPAADAPWIAVSGGSRTGPGSFTYTAEPNGSQAPRTASIAAGGQTHTVTQEAAPPPVCAYSLAPPTHTVGADGGERSVTVTTGAECTWTPAADAPWIAVGGGSRTGTGSFTYTVQPNSSQAPRTASIAAGGQTHTVTQEAAAPPPPVCTYSLDPPTHTVGADGGIRAVVVTTGSECAWAPATTADWLTINGATRTGPGTFGYAVQPNSSPSPRTASITVGGQTHTVTQTAAPPPEACAYALDSAGREFEEEGGEGSVRVTTASHCGWNAATSASWITVLTASGTGSGDVLYTVARNTDDDREATITIADQVHRVEQEEGDDDDDDDVPHLILTARLPGAEPGGSYCRTCPAPSLMH